MFLFQGNKVTKGPHLSVTQSVNIYWPIPAVYGGWYCASLEETLLPSDRLHFFELIFCYLFCFIFVLTINLFKFLWSSTSSLASSEKTTFLICYFAWKTRFSVDLSWTYFVGAIKFKLKLLVNQGPCWIHGGAVSTQQKVVWKAVKPHYYLI